MINRQRILDKFRQIFIEKAIQALALPNPEGRNRCKYKARCLYQRCSQKIRCQPEQMNGRQGNIQPDQADHKHSSAHKIIACIAGAYMGSCQIYHRVSRLCQHKIQFSLADQPVQFSKRSHKKGRCNRVGQNIKGIKKKDFFPVPASDLSEPFQKDQHHNHSRRPAHNLCKHPHGILSPVGHLCQKTIFKKRSVYSHFLILPLSQAPFRSGSKAIFQAPLPPKSR